MKESAFENFSEYAQDALDFARCQRPDGSFYGTSGVCRKGAETGAKEKEAKAAKPAKAPSAKAQASSDLKAKKAEVRSMDKTAKAADKAADKADKKFQKSKSPADQKEARRLDKEAKSANKQADKGQKELVRMAKSAQSSKGRESNVSLNKALATDGPKPTGKQRVAAMRELSRQENTLKNLKADNGSLTKPQQARLKLIKSAQREYEKG